MNKLVQIFLLSRRSLAVITSAVMMFFAVATLVKAQPKLSCFMTDSYGKVINLADICNAKSQLKLHSDRATLINHNIDNQLKSEKTKIINPPGETVYFVGDGRVPFTLGESSSIYYSGRPLVYVRKYLQTPQFRTRSNIRTSALGTETNNRGGNFSGRNPFIIYRYPK